MALLCKIQLRILHITQDVYACAYVHTYAGARVCVYIYIYIRLYVCIHIYKHRYWGAEYVYVYIYIYIDIRMRACRQAGMQGSRWIGWQAGRHGGRQAGKQAEREISSRVGTKNVVTQYLRFTVVLMRKPLQMRMPTFIFYCMITGIVQKR